MSEARREEVQVGGRAVVGALARGLILFGAAALVFWAGMLAVGSMLVRHGSEWAAVIGVFSFPAGLVALVWWNRRTTGRDLFAPRESRRDHPATGTHAD